MKKIIYLLLAIVLSFSSCALKDNNNLSEPIESTICVDDSLSIPQEELSMLKLEKKSICCQNI